MSDQPQMKELVFVSTKEYRLFGEFCDAWTARIAISGCIMGSQGPERLAQLGNMPVGTHSHLYFPKSCLRW